MTEELKNIKDLLRVITSTSNKVFIIGHNSPDLDSLASAIGLETLCKSLGKEAYIIIDDAEETIEPVVKRVRDDNSTAHNIITMQEFLKLKDNDSSLIVTDTNKEELVAVGNHLNSFKEIIVIDHHTPGATTIKSTYSYIPLSKDQEGTPKVKVSSASEIVAQLLLLAKVDCPRDVYTYLYGGIYLDTNRFDKNVGEKTHEVTHKLCTKGADTLAVRELLLSDYDEDKKVHDLVFYGTIFKAYKFDTFSNCTVAYSLNRDKPTTIYRRESLAKAADHLLKYKVDAVFVMGHIDEKTVSVSARSKGMIDVGKTMEYIGGGGNSQNAAAQLQGLPVTTLEDTISIALDGGMKVDGEVQPPKDSTIISKPPQYTKKLT